MTDSSGAGVGWGFIWRTKHLVECVDCSTGRDVPVGYGLLHTRDGLHMALQVGGNGDPVLVSLVAAPKLIHAIRQSIGRLLKVRGYL